MHKLIVLAVLSSTLPLALVGCERGDPDGDAGTGPTDGGGPLDARPSPGEDDGGPTPRGCPGATLCGAAEIVVDADWLASHLGEPDLQVVDVRGEADFVSSRIEGAVRLDAGALRATVDGIGGQVAPAADAEAAFRAAGLRRDAAVVVYGARTGTTPARVVWTLEYFGHERVALLEGGFATWSAGGRPTESGAAAAPAPSGYTIDAVDEARRVDAAFIASRLGTPGLALVDARSDGEYAAGHIPGALSVDWTRNLAGDDLLDDASLRALYETLDPATTTVTYCQTGSRASVAYVVLRALGFTDVRLYDGSWAEWGARTDLPREP